MGGGGGEHVGNLDAQILFSIRQGFWFSLTDSFLPSLLSHWLCAEKGRRREREGASLGDGNLEAEDFKESEINQAGRFSVHFCGYTEDGLIMEVTGSMFNKGKVKITGLKIIPTWVERIGDYKIIALDDQTPSYSWGADSEGRALSSYERTIGRLGGAYNNFRRSRNQDPVPEYLD